MKKTNTANSEGRYAEISLCSSIQADTVGQPTWVEHPGPAHRVEHPGSAALGDPLELLELQ